MKHYASSSRGPRTVKTINKTKQGSNAGALPPQHTLDLSPSDTSASSAVMHGPAGNAIPAKWLNNPSTWSGSDRLALDNASMAHGWSAADTLHVESAHLHNPYPSNSPMETRFPREPYAGWQGSSSVDCRFTPYLSGPHTTQSDTAANGYDDLAGIQPRSHQADPKLLNYSGVYSQANGWGHDAAGNNYVASELWHQSTASNASMIVPRDASASASTAPLHHIDSRPSAVPSSASSNDHLQPQRQQPRHANDLYTPRWVRGSGVLREGYCDSCQSWKVLKNSAYWYCQTFVHSISNVTGQHFDGPVQIVNCDPNADPTNSGRSKARERPRSFSSRGPGDVKGLCGHCGSWEKLNPSHRKNGRGEWEHTWGLAWLRHAHKVGSLTVPVKMLADTPLFQCHSRPHGARSQTASDTEQFDDSEFAQLGVFA